MTIVCIFHDRAEAPHARALATVVERIGLQAWFTERDAVGDDWRQEVTGALSRRDCLGAIVIWSDSAARNRIVVGEAEATLRERRRLLGVVLDDAQVPLGFESAPRVLLQGWSGEDGDALVPVREKLARIVASAGSSGARIDDIALGGRSLSRPAFVFSVSSYETQISPAKTLELLNISTPPAVLLSAYDVLGTRNASVDVTPSKDVLQRLEAKDTTIFLDSGNYEAYRFEDMFWQRSPWLLREATSRLRCDVVFCHDRIIEIDGSLEGRSADLARQLVAELERDALAAGRETISPIIHAPRLRDGTFASQLLPELCVQVARRRRPPLVAVAERELGDGILRRAKRVRSIRRQLDRLLQATSSCAWDR